MIAVTLVMTFIATRRRFGRYVYAYGGNPDAAELAGINTRWTIMKTFILMGVLCAIAAAISSARLNGATLDVGPSDELYVIAAAVVGGTSFAGGIGTIPGAVLGAFVMQALAYGMSFNGVNSPTQNIVAGIVLVVAVGFDTINRRRGGGARLRPRRSGTDGDRRAPRRDAEHQRGLRWRARRRRRDHRPSRRARSSASSAATVRASRRSMRTLSGAHPPDSGEILIDGEPRVIGNPRDAKALNIECIYQTLALADNVDAPANVFLGRELTTCVGEPRRRRDGGRHPQGHGTPEPELHAVQDAREVALRWAAPGGGHRAGGLLQRADPDHGRADRGARAGGDGAGPRPHPPAEGEGIGIFLISHDIHDVFDLSDRISVMYHGRIVDTVRRDDVTTDEVLAMIILGKKPEEVSRGGARRAQDLIAGAAAQSARNDGASAG